MFSGLKHIFRPLSIFYLLVVYIFASLIWWSYLLLDKNNQLHNTQLMVYEQQFYEQKGKNAGAFEETLVFQKLNSKKQRQNWMILGEGIVFLIILATGTIQIHRALRKEIMLNRQQRNFLLSITHELKSPLAGIKIALETIKGRILPEEKKELLTGNALADVERLGTLVDNLLMAAKIENESIQLASQELDVLALVKDIFRLYSNGLGKDHQMLLISNDPIYVSGDKMALMSIVSNLIENALKYSPKGTKIEVSALAIKQQFRFSVSDSGVGISEEDQKKIFDKFYRVGTEDRRKTKGTGLGLYIVHELVRKHGGNIQIDSEVGAGSTFILDIPLSKHSTNEEKASQNTQSSPQVKGAIS